MAFRRSPVRSRSGPKSIRGLRPRTPYWLSRAPLRRRAPFASLARCARSDRDNSAAALPATALVRALVRVRARDRARVARALNVVALAGAEPSATISDVMAVYLQRRLARSS